MKFRLYLAWLAAVLLLVACEGGNGGEGGKGNSNGDGPKEELPDNPNNPDNPDNPNSDSQGGATLPGVTTEVDYVYPGKTWEKTTFEECGYSDCGDQIEEFVKTNGDVTSLFIAVKGKELYKYGSMTTTYYIASSRKSLCSMLYGIAVDRGIIDLNTTIGTLIELGIIREDIDEGDIKGLLDIEKTATIEHCISARSGVFHQASNSGSTLDNPENVPPRGSKTPGTYYMYSNWDFNVSGAILDGYMGESIYDMFEREIAIPLQFEAWNRSKHSYSGDTKKSIYPAYHFKITAPDMARVGYLMLRKGRWANNNQIISEAWVEKSTSIISTRQETGNSYFGYGYMWWVLDRKDEPEDFQGTYTAIGAGGQYIMVIPKLDMVLAIKRNQDELTTSFGSADTYNIAKLIYKNRLY